MTNVAKQTAKIAAIVINISKVCWCFWFNAMSIEIEPGPASIGMASGVNENRSLFAKSFCTLLFFIPLCLEKEPVSNANPEVTMISPPAMRRASKLIPKKLSKYFPVKNEINKITKTFIEVSKQVLFRSVFSSSCVRPTKTGTVPKGFITENRAAKT